MSKDTNKPTVDEAKLQDVVDKLETFLKHSNSFSSLVASLSDLVPKTEDEFPSLSKIIGDWLGVKNCYKTFKLSDTYGPSHIALIMTHEYFRDNYDEVKVKGLTSDSLNGISQDEDDWGDDFVDEDYNEEHTNFQLGEYKVTLPLNHTKTLVNKVNGVKMMVSYGIDRFGRFRINFNTNPRDKKLVMSTIDEIKLSVKKCKYLKGQLLEVDGGGFNVLEPLPDQQFPVIEKYLENELYKNVINMFDKADEFAKFGLPAKRAIILEGTPGTGKTLCCRWLAKKLKSKNVTTFWVTAKSILGNGNVADIFEMARNLSPSLIIMEDMDLITGSRNNPFAKEETGALGELLNQMDGLTKNENMVIVATSNKVNSLDDALSDRPGRFDRIYKVGLPKKEIAENIAKSFLLSSGLSESVISDIDYSPVTEGNLSGAQIVEVLKGAFFEAIHVGKDIDSLSIKRSAKGLEDQRKAYGKITE